MCKLTLMESIKMTDEPREKRNPDLEKQLEKPEKENKRLHGREQRASKTNY